MNARTRSALGVCLLAVASLDCAVPWYPEPPPPQPYRPSVIRTNTHVREQPAAWSEQGLGPHGAPVRIVAFSPDGRLLFTADYDKPLLVWSVAERRLLRSLPHTGSLRGLEHHPTEALVIAAGEDRLWIRDLRTGEQRPVSEQSGLYASCLALSRDGARALTGTGDGHLFVWRTDTGTREIELRFAHDGYINAVAYNGHRPLLASAGADGVARIRDAADGREIAAIDTKLDQVRDVAWSPDGTRLALAIGDVNAPGVWIWSADTRTLEHQYSTRYAWADALSWSPDGEYLAVARGDQLEIWRAIDGHTMTSFSRSKRDLEAVHWNAAGSTIAYGGDDGWVWLERWSGP